MSDIGQVSGGHFSEAQLAIVNRHIDEQLKVRLDALSTEMKARARIQVRREVRRLVGWGMAVVTSLAGLGFFAIIRPRLEEQARDAAKTEISEFTKSEPSGLLAKVYVIQGSINATEGQVKRMQDDAEALRKATEIVKSSPVPNAAELAKTYESLSSGDVGRMLKRLDEIQRSIPTKITVFKAQALDWANRNSHQGFCSDRNQVMIAGAIGSTNGDFSPFCGELRLGQ
jgi:hypothetical protein